MTRKFFKEKEEVEVEELSRRPEDELMNGESMTLRDDISDQYYSQLFFVIGHIAIKMLTYVEHLEKELK